MIMSFFYEWRPYVSGAERRAKAQRELAKLAKKGRTITPIVIEGRTIAASFWGKSWCANLERYSDYANRLPRGRSYVRNGSVVDLQIAKGEVKAIVSGSALYRVKVSITPVRKPHWQAICRDCTGSIDSLVELLQGRLAKSVMDRVCREGDGLFPAPKEITLSCSCPDWADMCKHVAAVLYGVGARLDHAPELLFVLRGVDQNELIAGAGQDLSQTTAKPTTARVLADDDVAALFGLEMADAVSSPAPPAPETKESATKLRLPRKKAVKKAAARNSSAAKGDSSARTRRKPAKKARPKTLQRLERREPVNATADRHRERQDAEGLPVRTGRTDRQGL
jgi:uncharacterized Zn finger protein